MVFELIDLQSLGENALKEFHDTLSRETEEGREAAFLAAADRLIAKIEVAYAVAARLADREPTLEGTEAIWAKVVAICDDVALQLQSIGGATVSANPSYDRLLDYRNAAENRRQLHA